MNDIPEAQKKEINNFFRWGLPRTRHSQIVDSKNWYQVISEDYRSPAFNEVIFSDLSSDFFESKVLEVIAQYAEIGTDFKWCIGPYSAPSNSKEILLAQGFENWKARKMLLNVSGFSPMKPSESLRIEKVSPSNMSEFIALFLRCWSVPENQVEQMKDQLIYDHERNSNFERFIAFVENQPAGVASMVRNNQYGYFHATAVLPEFQGKGAYKALIGERVRSLKQHGVPYAISGAREKTSAPILEKVGFETLWETEMFLKRIN